MIDNDDLDDVLAKVRKLAKRPRMLSVISTTDGFSYLIPDDGGSYRQGEGIVPHGRRSSAMNIMAKKGKDKQPIFVAGERVASSDAFDAEISYVPKPIEPAFPGDPLADWPVLTQEHVALIHKNVALREKNQLQSNKHNAKEMIDLLATVVNKAKQDAPKIQRPKKEVPNVEA